MYELEASRAMAMATQKKVRLTFDEVETSTQGYLDVDADGVITGSAVEQVAFNKHGRGKWQSNKGKRRGKGKKGDGGPEVAFGRGAAPPLPIDSVRAGSVTLPDGHLELSKRGVTDPFGASGAIYLYHTGHPEAVAAISISGAASLRVWTYRSGAWQ
jgi:hypothetical protein